MIIGVVGPGSDGASDREVALAEQVGILLAEHGATVVCGGLGGVMEGVCRGAYTNNGTTIGLLPGLSKQEGNEYLTFSLPTGIGELRNGLIVNFSDAIICVGGSWGTLSEVALALRAGKYCVGLNAWGVDGTDRANHRQLQYATEAGEAVSKAMSAITGLAS